MTRRVECRFPVKSLLKIVCLGSVIVSANNSTQNDEVKTNSYTAVMVSTTTVPSILGTTTEKTANEERTIQSLMMNMLDGKEKSWSHKKKGILGTHNLDVKLPAQESFFCKFIKRQSVIMFSFCNEDDQGWGWKKKKKKKKKKAKKGGWGEKKKKKKKKGKKKGWGPPKKKKTKKKSDGWKPPTTTGWPTTTKAWKPPKTTKAPKGWGEEEEEEDEWEDDKNKKADDEADDDFGLTSQDEEYKPKKDYKGKAGVTIKPKPAKIKSGVSVSTSYLSEFDLDKWESSDDVKNNPEDLIHHHFYRGADW